MKRILLVLLSVLVVCALSACSTGEKTVGKEAVIALYANNVDTFSAAAESGNFDALSSIDGVCEVYKSDLDEKDPYVEISCGGEGLGPSTHYYGIVYSVADHYNAVFGSEFPLEEFKAGGQGYVWNSDDTDNRYYAEPLGNHFFYYKAHF